VLDQTVISSGFLSLTTPMSQKLSLLRAAFLKLIMGHYGPWYLLRSPFGSWHTSWHYDVEDERAMESYLINDDVDEKYGFPTRRAALKEILKSLDEEIAAGAGASYIEARQRVRDSLISAMSEQDPVATQNDFFGTPYEARLIEYWIHLDRCAADEKRAAAKQHAAFKATWAEQERRERAFEHVVHVFGEKVIVEINTAIESAWLIGSPKANRTVHGLTAGELMPMPQLARLSGQVVFCSPGRANHLSVKTPLSRRDTRHGYANHWKHSTWVNIVIPAVAQIIDRLELEAQSAAPPEPPKVS